MQTGIPPEDALSRHIVDCAIEVHRELGGPGLLESVYEEALVFELQTRGLHIDRQVIVPIRYKNHLLERRLRIDLIVDGIVLVECKAASTWNPIFAAQMLTYLRTTGLRLGLVLNFGETTAARGIHRVANNLY